MSTIDNCKPPKDFPSDYCRKLKSGIGRLQAAIQSHYEETFPNGRNWIAGAMREAERDAWATPFPSLFFPALAHLKVGEMMPPA